MKDTKFTATMTFESDKIAVQNLRTEFDLTEKNMMHFIIQAALENKQRLEELVAEFNTQVEEEKNQKKAAKLEEQIAKLKSKKSSKE